MNGRLAELPDLVERHATAPIAPCALPRVTLVCAEQPSDIEAELMVPVVCLVVAGEKHVQLGSTALRYGPGTFVVSALGAPITGQITRAPYRAVAVHLTPARVADVLVDLESDGGDDDGAALPPLEVGHADDELLDAFARLLRLLDDPDDRRVLAHAAERELLYRALRGPGGPVIRRFARTGHLASRADDMIAWIRAHPTERLVADELAERFHLSASTLYRHFRVATGLTPLQFQKQIRLQEARKLLLVGEATAAEAAARVGYRSPSQFNREYARLFGVSPGHDAAVRGGGRTPPT